MSAGEDRALRSAAKKKMASDTPSSGETSTVETHTWSKGTSSEQHGESTSTAPRPANVLNSKGSAQPAAHVALEYPPPVIEDDNESNGTVIDNPPGGKADTVSSKLSILRAELELQDAELERANRAAAAARSRLEIARIEASLPPSSTAPPEIIVGSRVESWVEQHRITSNHARVDRPALLPPPPSNSNVFVPPRDRPDRDHVKPTFVNRDLELLSNQVVQAVTKSNERPAMSRHAPELPLFDGNISEWIAFRAEFDDTASSFTDVANIGRIRKALRGEARLAVRAIMYTVTNPYEIIEALERQFGDPEEIVLAEMHNVKRMPRLADDNSNITTFAAQVANVVSTIKSLRQEEFLYAPELVNKIVDKMNLIVRYEWNKYRAGNKSVPGLVAMAQFLNEISSASRKTYSRSRPTRANVNFANEHGNHAHGHAPSRTRNALGTRDHSRKYESSSERSESDYEDVKPRTVAQVHRKPQHSKKNVPSHSHAPRQTKQANPTHSINVTRCVICNGEHKVSLCSDFAKLQIAQRWEVAKNSKLCFRCLDAAHKNRAKCKYVACGVNQCEAGHHRMLHGLNTPPAPAPAARANVSSSINHVHKANTYLKIVPVEISGPLGVVNTYALLDDGSSLTMIERHIADRVAPRTKSEPLSIEGVGGNVIDDTDSCRIELSIRGACSRNLEKLTAYTIGNLNLAAQSVGRDLIDKCDHLREIGDELCYDFATPTILVGQDHWHLLVSRQIRSGARDQPVASLTKLGWTLHGQHEASRSTAFVVNHVKQTNSESEILTLLKENFSIESLGIENKVPRTDPDKRALDILDATCVRSESGTAYQAGLLWRTDEESLPDNKGHAVKRLHSLECKLDKDANLKKEYAKQIQNLIDKNYAEIVQSTPPPGTPRVWYLPHFPVFHAQKLKMRLVFDAASRAYGKCLNDALLTGPDLLQSLFGVLLRFREGKIAIVADVREMFLQIEVAERDRDSLRFLWRGEERQCPPVEYRMKKLIFGSACSPATALYVKNKNAKDNEKLFPEASRITVRNSYMDDFLIALDGTEDEARRITNEVYELNKLASFELTGFVSNRPKVVRDVDKGASDQKVTPLGPKSETERTLGLIWNHARDTLGFNVNLRNTPQSVLDGTALPTKRQITSAVMSVYDPLGHACPITIVGKALIQDVWRTGIGWDEVIQPESVPTWRSFIKNVKLLKDLEIERYVPACEREAEIHTFCDASEKVYAAVVYLVASNPEGGKSSCLVAAKARVAPLKTISIPRLELQSCVLGTRLTKSVLSETDYKITRCHYWSDSRTVLAWIKADPRSFKSFVAHRLAEIEDTTSPTEWRWVPSALNTADDATKGVPADFGKNHRWFHGPDFIRREVEEWPADKSAPASAPPTGEERPPRVVLALKSCDTYDYLPKVSRFSNYTRLVRATATVLLAAEVFKAKLRKDTEIEMNRFHLVLAETLLVRRSQEKSYSEEIRRLRREEPMPKGSPLARIAVKLNEKGTLLLDSRIDRWKEIPVLHAKEELTKLIIAHNHAKFNHGNHKTVMNELNQRYHIVGLRGALRYLCAKCQWCKTHKGKPMKLPYGDLPPERLMTHQPAFTATACDLFGPITITIGRRHEKRWGALFTCLTTRAVHMELVASLSASSLILALRRMMARRGTPTVLYSDNGTNLVGSEREIADALQAAETQLKTFAHYKEIVWKKIPPGNPSAGGAWERLVSSIKTALRATLNEKHPPEEVLHTLLLEAEHIVNSRPLTPITSERDGEESLTPNHFLLGRSNAMSPFGSFKDIQLTTKTWKQAQALADHFWTRWTNEYRPLLMARTSRGRTDGNLEPGDIVIIVDGTMPRGTWPRGEVVKIHPGPDGVVRIAEVRTAAGLVRRPSSRLISVANGVGTRGGDCRK